MQRSFKYTENKRLNTSFKRVKTFDKTVTLL